jgi:deoxyadenosine/deoxycytidine kinase
MLSKSLAPSFYLKRNEQLCTVPEIYMDLEMKYPSTRSIKQSSLVRDSSEELLNELAEKETQVISKMETFRLRLPNRTLAPRNSGDPDESVELNGFQTKGGRLSFRYRLDAYSLLRGFVLSGKYKARFDLEFASDEEEAICAQGEHVYISIEGNIGVGKTTLCGQTRDFINSEIINAIDKDDIVHASDSVEYIEEKVHPDWLNAFLNDNKGMATLFQFERLFATINAAKEMGATMKAHASHGFRVHCIGDRLPLGNVAFAVMHYANGGISKEKFLLYGTTLASGGPYIYPDVVYLHCPINKVVDRIKSRNRPGEADAYKIEYLEFLDETNLFVMLYMWYTNIVEVSFIDWQTFQDPVDVLDMIETNRLWKKTMGNSTNTGGLFRTLRETIRNDLLTMSYAEMKDIASMLSWKNGVMGSSMANPQTLSEDLKPIFDALDDLDASFYLDMPELI